MLLAYAIIPNKRGYVELWIEGKWHSNHDTYEDALREVKEIYTKAAQVC